MPKQLKKLIVLRMKISFNLIKPKVATFEWLYCKIGPFLKVMTGEI